MSKKNEGCDLGKLDDDTLRAVIAILRKQNALQEDSWVIAHSIHRRKMETWTKEANGLNIVAFLKLERELADSHDAVKEAQREWGRANQSLTLAEAEWSERHPFVLA